MPEIDAISTAKRIGHSVNAHTGITCDNRSYVPTAPKFVHCLGSAAPDDGGGDPMHVVATGATQTYNATDRWGLDWVDPAGNLWRRETDVCTPEKMGARRRTASGIAKTFASSDIQATPDSIKFTSSHLFTTGQAVQFTTTGSLSGTGLSTATTYYVRNDDADEIGVFTTEGNALANTSRIALSVSGSGTHTCTALSNVNQHAMIQRMADLAASSTWAAQQLMEFFIPFGEYHIESSVKLYSLLQQWTMEGYLWVPHGSRITAIKVKGYNHEAVPSTLQRRPRIELCAKKEYYSSLPKWDTYTDYPRPYVTDSYSPYNSDRTAYLDETDVGVSIVGLSIGLEVTINGVEGFCISCRMAADSSDAESTAMQGAKIRIRNVRADKVSLLVGVRGSSASYWVNSNHFSLEDKVGSSTEMPDKPRYAILVTANAATEAFPNANYFSGGEIGDAWARGKSGVPGVSVLIDRGLGNNFETYRADTAYGMPYCLPNPVIPECFGNTLRYINFGNTLTPIHNLRNNVADEVCNNIIEPGWATTNPLGLHRIASFSATRDCYTSGKDRVYFRGPWCSLVYYDAITSLKKYASTTGADQYNDCALHNALDPQYIHTGPSTRQLIGIYCRVRSIRRWNRISWAMTPAARAMIRAYDSNGVMLNCASAAKTFAPGDVDHASTDNITVTAHGFETGQKVYLSTTATLPAGLDSTYGFWVIKVDANTIRLATTSANAYAGTNVDMSSGGSGTHTLTPMPWTRSHNRNTDMSVYSGGATAIQMLTSGEHVQDAVSIDCDWNIDKLFIAVSGNNVQLRAFDVLTEGMDLEILDPFDGLYSGQDVIQAIPLNKQQSRGQLYLREDTGKVLRCRTAGPAATTWSGSLAVTKNQWLRTPSGGRVYFVKTAGTTGGSEPTGTSGDISDGTATLNYLTTAAAASFDYGSSNYHVVSDSSTSITLSASSHAGMELDCTATGGNITVTINTSHGCAVGDDGYIVQADATRTVTVSASGVTFQPTGSKTTTSQWDMIYWKCVGTNTFLIVGGQIPATGVANVAKSVPMEFVIDSGTAITTGMKHSKIVPCAGTITAVYVVRSSATSGTTTIDVCYEDDGTYPVAGDTITAAHPVSITSTGTTAADTDLSDWTSTTVAKGALLGIEVEANNDSTYLSVIVLIKPSE